MKIKLLKKVRERYRIIRVDFIGGEPIDDYLSAKDKFGLPFFVAIDTANPSLITDGTIEDYRYYNFHKTFDEARTQIVDWVVTDYTYYRIKTRRKRKPKETNVWYNDKGIITE
jgi:hypothetical protein